MRASGILMHISSLPNAYGIGTFGQSAYDFVDFLEQAGQKYWQILPIGPTSYGDSPYQSFSTFAGNPYFIDFDLLAKQKLLEPEEYIALDWQDSPTDVSYEKLYRNRFAVLKLAYQRGFARDQEKIDAFRQKHAHWIEDYALFMALKDFFEGKAWSEWNYDIKRREDHASGHYRRHLKEEINFWVYLQYLFDQQWTDLKAYANLHGVSLIGDLPIYVAMDSADVWANPHLFQLDWELNPTGVAGVPPDYFAPQGQLWGNPLYAWEHHRNTGYAWWIDRVRAAVTTYDVLRIDHFRGFAGYYAVPYGDATAENGHWETGPGMDVFHAIRSALGECNIIAEDLGVLTEDVYALLNASGFPGMKVLQFAFNGDADNEYLPHNHIRNCVVYTGTHDNDTLMSWWETALDEQQRSQATDYLSLSQTEGIHWGMIRGAWASVANLAIAPIQDFLALGHEARMNHPSTIGCNWRVRITPDLLTDQLASKIRELTLLYHR